MRQRGFVHSSWLHGAATLFKRIAVKFGAPIFCSGQRLKPEGIRTLLELAARRTHQFHHRFALGTDELTQRELNVALTKRGLSEVRHRFYRPDRANNTIIHKRRTNRDSTTHG